MNDLTIQTIAFCSFGAVAIICMTVTFIVMIKRG